MTYQYLMLEVDSGIATITVNRPDKLNALNAATIAELGVVIDEVRQRGEIAGVILTGAGRAFVAGADISELQSQSPLSAKLLARAGQEVFRRFETSPKPVIAAVNGFALGGGCELAMACHIRIASEHAKFGQPEVKLGILPGYGATQRLPRLIGKGRALQLLLTAEVIDADEAYRIGLVNRVVAADALIATATGMMRQILANGTLAVALCIEAVGSGLDMSLDEGLVLESNHFGLLTSTDDMREGMAAFLGEANAGIQGQVTRSRAWLTRATFTDFRNLEKTKLELPEAGLAIIGENGQGKTNLLEGIYYMQVLRSVRGARDQDLARFGTKGFHLGFQALTDSSHEFSVGFEAAGKRKKVTIDGSVITRLSDAFGALPSVMFSPRDIQMIAGPPSERRRFLDLLLALSSRRYLRALQHYRAALARRNAALRDAGRGRGDEATVEVWEPALAEHGAVLICERARWVSERGSDFSALASAVGESGELHMAYQSAVASTTDPAPPLAALLEKQRLIDIKRGMTQSGPHRDDLGLTLNGRELRLFGSAGQQRTAAIALRMLEGATLREARGMQPLLLLDDPFAELDARRSARILELLRSAGLGQTILVVPRESDIPPELLDLERRGIHGGVVGKQRD